MSRGRIFAVALFVAVSAGFAPACSSSDDEPRGGGPDAGDTGGRSSGGSKSTGGVSAAGGAPASGGQANTGGSAGFGGTVECGEKTCTTTAANTGVDAYACCTSDGDCGIKIPLAVECLPKNQFGTLNDDCEPLEVQGFTYPGCCHAEGCGIRITFEGLGCISNTQRGVAPVACNQSGEPVDGG